MSFEDVQFVYQLASCTAGSRLWVRLDGMPVRPAFASPDKPSIDYWQRKKRKISSVCTENLVRID